MPKRYGDLYGKIASFENLYEAYRKAAEHRDLRDEVLEFTACLEENLMGLRRELAEMPTDVEG